MRVGHGFDAHRLVEGRKLVLGGIHVPYARGLLGHSDGDALAHAIADAVLGAAGLGDLGRYFPDTDARWKDASSTELLMSCVQKVSQAGFAIANVDSTVVLEHPKLAPFIDDMRAKLAEALDTAPPFVSVKAKTSEGLGFTGDGSGVVAYAVVTLRERAP